MKEPHGGSASIAFKHDGTKIVSGETDGSIRLWDANNGDELLTMLGHKSTVRSVSFSPDDTLIVSVGHDRTLKLWNAATGKEIWAWKDDQNMLKSAHFTPNNKQIITSNSNGAIRRWDVASRTELKPITESAPAAGEPCISISADGAQIASGSHSGMIKIWDAVTHAEVNTLRGHVMPVRSLCFSPDRKRIVSITGGLTPSSDHNVKLWDVATGEELISLKGQSHEGSNIAFSPDGSMIAWADSGVDPAIKLWDVETAEEAKVIKGIGFRRPKLVTDDDGMKFVISDGTKETVIWDSRSIKTDLELAKSVPQFVSSGADLLLIDPNFRHAPKEKAFRQFKAKLDPSFHAVQATIAKKKQNWYAATFHRAWELKGDPNRKHAYYNFQKAYKKLQAQYDDKGQELNDFLSSQVLEVAELPAPKNSLLPISATEAEDINRNIWQKVRELNSSSEKNGVAALSQTEINSLRNVCIHHMQQRQYLTTLLVAEYRLKHLKLHVMAVEMQISNMAQALKTKLEWSPVELAVLAMSQHKLGNKEKAAEYRSQLNEAMKLAKYRDDEDNKAFFAEANQLLGAPATAETDDE